ncbi:glycoside hydrolase superfamily [Zopfochytrium polystomum]|nr:glycoside hydrolase superfamily [Zopfochytrium polystomum]
MEPTLLDQPCLAVPLGTLTCAGPKSFLVCTGDPAGTVLDCVDDTVCCASLGRCDFQVTCPLDVFGTNSEVNDSGVLEAPPKWALGRNQTPRNAATEFAVGSTSVSTTPVLGDADNKGTKVQNLSSAYVLHGRSREIGAWAGAPSNNEESGPAHSRRTDQTDTVSETLSESVGSGGVLVDDTTITITTTVRVKQLDPSFTTPVPPRTRTVTRTRLTTAIETEVLTVVVGPSQNGSIDAGSAAGNDGYGFCRGLGPARFGYVASWSQYRTGSCAFNVDSIDLSKWHYLLFAFGQLLGSSVSINSDDERYVKSMTDLGVKLILSIGGWGYDLLFLPIASSDDGRRNFATSVLQALDKYGFVGVDLDWEYPRSYLDSAGNVIPGSDGDNFAQLLAVLREVLGPNRIITVAVPFAGFATTQFPLRDIAVYADFINLMSYDESSGGSLTGTNTGNPVITSTLDTFISLGLPPSKILLGLAYYGRSYRLASTSSDPTTCNAAISPGSGTGTGCEYVPEGAAKGTCSGTSGIVFAVDVARDWDDGAIPQVDSDQGTVWYIRPGSGDWVTVDSPDTFRAKDRLAKARCLGGTHVWTIDQDPQQRFLFW